LHARALRGVTRGGAAAAQVAKKVPFRGSPHHRLRETFQAREGDAGAFSAACGHYVTVVKHITIAISNLSQSIA
jgi:hypothetical protein